MYKDDEDSNARRAELQSRQINDQIETDRRIDQGVGRKEGILEDYYGSAKSRLESEINTLTAQLKKSGLAGAIYRSIHGKSDLEALNNAKLSLDNMNMRIEERRQFHQSQSFMTRENQAVKHDIQRDTLEMEIHNPSIKPKTKDITLGKIVVSDQVLQNMDMAKGHSR